MAWLSPVEGITSASSSCRRIAVAPGVEVFIDEQHPALRLNGDTAVIAEALRQALLSVVELEAPEAFPGGMMADQGWTPNPDAPELIDEPQVSTEVSG
jgi:hypothetical protein